ncbi:MAG: cyclic nucleotide-binding domain-containing protein [Polyangiaceae bacterium]
MTHPLFAFFSQIRLFSQLDADELNEFLRAVQPVQLDANRRVFATNDPGDSAFVIENGRVDITLPGEHGPIVVASLGAGEVFGEIALLDGGPRSATATTAAPTRLLRIDKSEFDFLRRNFRPAGYKIIRAITTTVTQRIRLSNQRIARLLSDETVEAPTAPSTGSKNRKSFLQRMFSSPDD